jgi:hypothetical protein
MTDAEPHRPAEETAPRPAFSAIPQPENPETGAAERRRHPLVEAAEAALGWIILLFLAALGGALIVVYWPWITGSGADETAMADRVSALERQVGQLAAGRAPQAAAASFAAVERRLSTLKSRVDADEARLSAVEKSQNSGSGPDSGTIAALRSAIAKNSAELATIHQQLGEQTPLAAAPGRMAHPNPSETNLAPAQAIARLNTRLAQTQVELTGLSRTLHDVAGKLSRLETTVAQLEKHAPPADLRQQLQSFAAKSTVAELGQRLTRIERDTPARVMTKAAAMLALAELVQTSASGAPYEREVHALATLLPPSPALRVLRRYAHQGVPSPEQLGRRLDHAANAILEAERLAYAPNWFARTWAELGNLVSVRRIGSISGNTTEAHLARAEQALAHGDVASAVTSIAGLDRPAQAAAATWLRAARARLAIDAAARTLGTMILAQESQKSVTSGTGAR